MSDLFSSLLIFTIIKTILIIVYLVIRHESTGNTVQYNGSLLYLQSDKISIGPYGDFLYQKFDHMIFVCKQLITAGHM
jgi:hypothetical protein